MRTVRETYIDIIYVGKMLTPRKKFRTHIWKRITRAQITSSHEDTWLYQLLSMRLNSSCNPRLSSSRAPYGLADPAENASELSLSPVPVPLPLHILISDKFQTHSFSQSTLVGILLPWSALEMEPLLPLSQLWAHQLNFLFVLPLCL